MKKQLLGAASILAVGLIAGSAISLNAANAADNTTTTTAPSTTTTADPKPDLFSATPVRDDEKAVSADIESQLSAAALAEVPGATIIRVETDADGATYEVHMKKADGSVVTVLFDADLKVTSTEQGFGKGPQGGHGPHGGPGDHDGDANGFHLPTTPSTTGTNQNG